MTHTEAADYVGHYVDDALSPDPFTITDTTVLVGWQCGFEPMFVAVKSFLGVPVDTEEAITLATDLLVEIGWLAQGPDFETKMPDHIIRA